MRKPLFFLNLNRLKYNKLSAIIVYCRIYIFNCLTIAFILTTSQIFYSPSFMAHETFLNYNSAIYNYFVQCGNNFLTSFCFVVSCHEALGREVIFQRYFSSIISYDFFRMGSFVRYFKLSNSVLKKTLRYVFKFCFRPMFFLRLSVFCIFKG